MEQRIFLSELITKYKITQVNGPHEVEVDKNSGLLQGPKDFPVKFTKIQ